MEAIREAGRKTPGAGGSGGRCLHAQQNVKFVISLCIRKVSLGLVHQSLQTTEMYLRTDSVEKQGTISEWRSPGLGK